MRDNKKAKYFSALNIVINILILGVFKYYNFFIQSFAEIIGGNIDDLLLDVALPVGISFYTFSALSYTIDVYKGKQEPTKDLIQFASYVSFFPQLLAGPIGRSTDLLSQYGKARAFEYEESVIGLRQILWGLFKKLVIADNCAIYVDSVWKDYSVQSGSTLLLAAILFSFQIYADFSGYSDMAIGIARLFGIKLKRNFNVPYFSRDIAEFWRRWHISLTGWFRDYIYIPLGGSRCSKSKIVRNTFIIFLISGLWHGANWTFIAWGAYHAFLFLPLILLGINKRHKDPVADGKLLPSAKEFGQMLLTFGLLTIGWIIFRADSLMDALSFMRSMVSNDLISVPWLMTRSYYVPLFIGIAIMTVVEWIYRNTYFDLAILNKHKLWRWVFYYALIIFGYYFMQVDEVQFIYSNF